jgi:hypothetical protein
MALNEDQLKDKHSEVSDELRSHIKKLETVITDYRREHGKLTLFFNQIKDVIQAFPTIETLYSPTIVPSSHSVCAAVLHISDTHMGSVQDSNEIEGFNEYNPEICKQRCMNYVEKVIKWNQLHRLAYQINEAHVIVTGDLISGDIHDELRITNAYPLPVQTVESGILLARQIAYIAPHFSKVIVHFLVEDNHSRLTKKPQAKEAGFNSMNYLVGKIAELYLVNQSNVEFNIYPMYEKVISILNRKYLILHGHNIRGWMGIPWYSIERKIAKEATARMGLMMKEAPTMEDYQAKRNEIGFHKMIFGHWHQPMDHPLYSCSGSVQGTDAYDHKDGRYAEPSQSVWLIHPKHGEFDRTNFDL